MHNVVQNNKYDDDDEDDEDDFETYARRKIKRFYVGGFCTTMTEKKLTNYVQRRGVPVTWIIIRRYERQNRAVIRLNVDGENSHLLFDEGFWPRDLICRRWYTKNQYMNSFTNHSSRNSYDTHDNRYNDDAISALRALGDKTMTIDKILRFSTTLCSTRH